MSPTVDSPPHPPVATRRRGAALVGAILRAALDELQSVGYAKLTMEGVANAAGTGKAALYRRWSSKDELVADALRQSLPTVQTVRLVGSVPADVLALLRFMRDAAIATNGAAFQSVKNEAVPMLHHSVVQEQILDPVRDLLLTVLAEGAERGEVRPSAVNARSANVGPAMLVHYALTHGAEIPDVYLESIVDDVIVPMIRP